MKKLALLLTIAVNIAQPARPQNRGGAELSLGYGLGLPRGVLNANTNALHGATIRVAYILPKTEGRVTTGLDVLAGTYASFTREQPFSINGAPPTMVPVNYSSNVTTLTADIRFEALRIGGVGVFAGIKGGGAKFRSGFTIEDPDDPDGCEALDRDRLARDFAPIAGAEGGVNIDLSMFTRAVDKNVVIFQLYGGFLRGGSVNYINVDRRELAAQHHQHGSTDDGGSPVYARFVQVSTGIQHEHEVARLYTSPVQYTNFGLSVMLRMQ